MRIVRVGATRPTYGLLEDGSRRIIGLSGDPLFQQVTHSGEFFDLDEVRLLAPVLPRSKMIVLDPAGLAGGLADQQMCLVPNTAIAGPDDPIEVPEWAGPLTLEAGLVIIAKTILKDVDPDAAPGLVLGTCLAARLCAAGVAQAVESAWDRCCPIGPWVEVMGEAEPHTDACTVQVGDTDTELEPVPYRLGDALARASQLATLLPGDMVMIPWPGRIPVTPGESITLSHALLGDLRALTRPVH